MQNSVSTVENHYMMQMNPKQNQKIFKTRKTLKLKNIQIVSLIPYQELCEKYAKARINIIHAGIGTFLDILEVPATPLVIPRLPEKGEHVDNHQRDFAYFASKGLSIPVAFTYAEFKERVLSFTQNSEILSTKKSLVTFLDSEVA